MFQAKYGTGVPTGAPLKTAKEDIIASRKKAMANAERAERSAPSRPPAAKKPKVAPLMAKSMQFYKKAFRR